MNRILLAEDHERLARLISAGLAGAGIAADLVHRLDAAWTAVQQMPYGALVVDRGLPDGDGLLLLRHLRATGSRIPCLVLTARDALHDRIEGLEAGADDYLPKPFAMDEMVARVRALLRRPSAFRSLDPCRGDLTLRSDVGILLCNGRESVTLPPAEMQIMLMLMHSHEGVVRRSALEAAAWGLSEAVTPNALDVALHRIRRKLLAIGSRLRIVNVRGLGYALREDELA